jgi:hypothetical protein
MNGINITQQSRLIEKCLKEDGKLFAKEDTLDGVVTLTRCRLNQSILMPCKYNYKCYGMSLCDYDITKFYDEGDWNN